VAGTLTAAQVAANWDALGVELKRMGRLPVAAFVREGVPTDLTNDTLTIVFAAQFKFHHGQVADRYRDVIEEALERLFQRKLKVDARLAEAGQSVEAAPVQTTQAVEVGVEVSPTTEEAPATVGSQEPAAEASSGSDETGVGGDAAAASAEVAESGGVVVAKSDTAEQSPVDRATERTLSLFEGSQVVGDDE
jgi:chromosomal replication initiation ATPase DnaA